MCMQMRILHWFLAGSLLRSQSWAKGITTWTSMGNMLMCQPATVSPLLVSTAWS